MSQQRVYDYASDADSSLDNLARYAALSKGVYRGLGFSVDINGDISIAAGQGVQHNGVVWSEDATNTVDFTPSAAAADYTVVATYNYRAITGGVAVQYSLESGILTDVTDGVVLGWVYYPGGSVPLVSDYLVEAPKLLTDMTTANTLLKAYSEIELVAPLDRLYTFSTGADVTITANAWDVANYVLHQSVERSPTAPVGSVSTFQYIQFYAGIWRPRSFEFYVQTTASPCAIQAVVYDTTLAAVGLAGSPITSVGAWSTQTVTVPRTGGTFTYGQPYTLRLAHVTEPGSKTQIGRIKVNYSPYPLP